jgi:DNA-directed RNA polymerase subunit RPC12/RpoP
MSVGTFECAECGRRLGYAGRGPYQGPDGPVCVTCAEKFNDLTLPDE